MKVGGYNVVVASSPSDTSSAGAGAGGGAILADKFKKNIEKY